MTLTTIDAMMGKSNTNLPKTLVLDAPGKKDSADDPSLL